MTYCKYCKKDVSGDIDEHEKVVHGLYPRTNNTRILYKHHCPYCGSAGKPILVAETKEELANDVLQHRLAKHPELAKLPVKIGRRLPCPSCGRVFTNLGQHYLANHPPPFSSSDKEARYAIEHALAEARRQKC